MLKKKATRYRVAVNHSYPSSGEWRRGTGKGRINLEAYMVYSYKVKRGQLTDDQIQSLGTDDEVTSDWSPRDIQGLYCFDCLFPNGDVHPLTDRQIDLLSCYAYEPD